MQALRLFRMVIGFCPCVFTPLLVQAQTFYATSTLDGSILRISSTGTVSIFATGLNRPRGLAYDGKGTLYVACGAEIGKVNPAGVVSHFVTLPVAPISFGPPEIALRLAIDSRGVLYAARMVSNSQIFEIKPSGAFKIRALAAPTLIPNDLAADIQNNVYFTARDRIIKLNPAGNTKVFVDSLKQPREIAFDPKGNLVVVDHGPPRVIKKIDQNGVISNFLPVNGVLESMAIDRRGIIYYTDVENLGRNCTIYQVPANGVPHILASGLPRIDTLVCDQSVFSAPPVAPPAATPKFGPGKILTLLMPALILIIGWLIFTFTRKRKISD